MMFCKCGETIRGDYGEVVNCECGYRTMINVRTESLRVTKPVEQKLGDWTERQLESIGVTKDRYRAAKELFGLAPTCGCDARKQWLNSVSDWWRGS